MAAHDTGAHAAPGPAAPVSAADRHAGPVGVLKEKARGPLAGGDAGWTLRQADAAQHTHCEADGKDAVGSPFGDFIAAWPRAGLTVDLRDLDAAESFARRVGAWQ